MKTSSIKTSTKNFAIVLAVLGMWLPALSQPGRAAHRVDLKGSQLHSGANQISASGDLKLIAMVSNGKITGFQVKDKAGKDMNATVQRAPVGGGGAPDKLCKTEICVRNKDGGKECWEVYVDCKIVDTVPKGNKL
jgi:hypothetical protein